MAANTNFETETCSRCGGSGHYSFNMRDGTKCYGCHGSGVKYTKRGAVARQFYSDSLYKPANEVKIGDKVFDTYYRKWLTVIGVELGDEVPTIDHNGEKVTQHHLSFLFKTKNTYSSGHFENTPVKSVVSEEERVAKMEAAIEYQSTLTKAGKVSKRKAKAAA